MTFSRLIMIIHVIKKRLNVASNTALFVETILAFGCHNLSLIKSTYPSTIIDILSVSYARVLTQNSMSAIRPIYFLQNIYQTGCCLCCISGDLLQEIADQLFCEGNKNCQQMILWLGIIIINKSFVILSFHCHLQLKPQLQLG